MKIKDYSIIETQWIESEIVKLTKQYQSSTSKIDKMYFGSKLALIKEINSKLKPLTPIVENAFDGGIKYCDNNIRPEDIVSKQNYINNTIIE